MKKNEHLPPLYYQVVFTYCPNCGDNKCCKLLGNRVEDKFLYVSFQCLGCRTEFEARHAYDPFDIDYSQAPEVNIDTLPENVWDLNPDELFLLGKNSALPEFENFPPEKVWEIIRAEIVKSQAERSKNNHE